MAKKKSEKSNQTKKQLKKEIAVKIESVLPEIKLRLGEKKFNKRIKKLSNLLIVGMHLNGDEKKDRKTLNSYSIKTIDGTVDNLVLQHTSEA